MISCYCASCSNKNNSNNQRITTGSLCRLILFVLGCTYSVLQFWQIFHLPLTTRNNAGGIETTATIYSASNEDLLPFDTQKVIHPTMKPTPLKPIVSLPRHKSNSEPLPSWLSRTSPNVSFPRHDTMTAFQNDSSLKLDEWDNDITLTTTTTAAAKTALPAWLQEYRTWHAQQRALLNANNWRNTSYLIMQCLDTDVHCGGTADRLRPVLFCLLLAYQHERLLLIHWTTPKPLEAFLVPPSVDNGLDWRLPDFVELEADPVDENIIVSDRRHLEFLLDKQRQQKESSSSSLPMTLHTTIWHFRYQSHDAGEAYFDEHRPPNSPTFAQLYHTVWPLLFVPTLPIARQIQHYMTMFGLIPNQYSAIHFRAAYKTDGDHIGAHRMRFRIQNAINCAMPLGPPKSPILVASDTNFAIDIAMAYAQMRQEQQRYIRPIVARMHHDQDNNNNSTNANSTNSTYTNHTLPLHLEKAVHAKQRPASDYYDIFVDLYLMGMSQCVVYTKGGFGYWARLMSFNSSCGFRYHSQRCRWISSSSSSSHDTNNNDTIVTHNDV